MAHCARFRGVRVIGVAAQHKLCRGITGSHRAQIEVLPLHTNNIAQRWGAHKGAHGVPSPHATPIHGGLGWVARWDLFVVYCTLVIFRKCNKHVIVTCNTPGMGCGSIWVFFCQTPPRAAEGALSVPGGEGCMKGG